ncbi:hypothetical protein BH11MYX2_BH11MYX2_25500 [soil metagenome]
MLKFLRVATAIAVLSPALAHADLPNGATLTWQKFKIHEDGGDLKEPADDFARRHYLNLAHCVCSRESAGIETTFSYELRSTADTNTNKPAEIWVGTMCDDETLRATHCQRLDNVSIPNIDLIVTTPATIEVPFYTVVNGFQNMDACQEREGDAFLWTLVDSDGDGTYDYTGSQSIGATSSVAGIDTKPPPIPTDFEAASSDNGISLSWKQTTNSDIFAYAAFCAKQDGTPAKENVSSDVFYQTPRTLCDLESDIALTPTDIAVEASDDPDAGMPAAAVFPPEIGQLDRSFLCGSTTSQTALGMSIDGLENGVAYSVAVIAIDRYGNAAGVQFNQTITPKPATDFWEDLHDRGSKVEGGFCLGTTTPWGGGPGAGLLALAIAFILIPRARRRTFVRVLGPAAGLLVFGLATPAHAQAPYWASDDNTSSSEAIYLGDNIVKWNIGLRLGPYTPQIDSQLGANGTGPYKQMFGGYRVIPMLDIDRIVWSGFGQLGFGGSIGYMQKTAHAFTEGSSPDDVNRMRTPGNSNTFRLLPLQATAVYRFTVLDDLYGIPVVPYLRGGLAYYLWMVRTNGSTSKACIGGGETSTCDGGEKALGATLGVTGAIGIAFRAERIDSSTALSMRQSGLEHAGFYAELNFAKVDGFGSDSKLSVGDNTWFVGANFEF